MPDQELLETGACPDQLFVVAFGDDYDSVVAPKYPLRAFGECSIDQFAGSTPHGTKY